jgi:thioredoxin 1
VRVDKGASCDSTCILSPPSRIIEKELKTKTMAGDNTLTFDDQAFDRDVLNSEVPVLVDFWAPWCGPCRAMSPTVDAIAAEYAGKIKVGKLNTDENQETAMRYRVASIPTLLLFKGGQVVDQ